jgi:hypothetical protein
MEKAWRIKVAQAIVNRGKKEKGAGMTNAFDYKGQPSIWTRDAELKMINNGKILGLKRREQIREKEIQGHHPLQARKNKK